MTLSIEFIWKGTSEYLAGTIGFFDFYIDGKKRYTIDIPNSKISSEKEYTLAFKGASNNVDYLIVNHLETTKKFSLKAAIFNKIGSSANTQTLRQQNDGSSEEDYHHTREDISINLDVNHLAPSFHYKMILTHDITEQGFSATFVKSGLCKQKAPPQSSNFFANNNQSHKNNEPFENDLNSSAAEEDLKKVVEQCVLQ